MREVQDHYFRKAKEEGFLSRAAYKLIEIDDRKKVLKKGDRVLDCGCAPGSWLQVASHRVGLRGSVLGIDLQEVTHRFQEKYVQSVQGDIKEFTHDGELFDVILSDMAPNTSGDHTSDHFQSVRLCEALLDRCPEMLRQGGKLVMKVFEGEAYPELFKRTKSMFESVKGFKPKASRSESSEMYIIATGYISPPP